jgi:5'-3' exonuclease
MGITSFFPWFSRTFSRYVQYVRYDDTLPNIDNVLVDMNGIFHPAAQKTFRYGKYHKSLLNQNMPEATLEDFFKEVTKEIDRIVTLVPPRKRIVLCVDGVAPVAKQVQQRQRRYKAAMDSSRGTSFDSNSLTPGSQTMNALCDYVGEYIKKFKDVEVIYSPSSVPGEGEMKLMNFVRYYMPDGETAAVYGLDADIILLSLCATRGSHGKRMYVVRERDMDHAVVDVSHVRSNLAEKLKWKSKSEKYIPDNAITDFVFMCFFVGNDFLKRAPGVDIVTGTVERIIDVYKESCSMMGHITNAESGQFNSAALSVFLGNFGKLESSLFETKIHNLSQYIEDPMFQRYVLENKTLDIRGYKAEYYKEKFNGDSLEKVCREYMDGLDWVLGYYTCGVPSWKWYYPYNYSPFISDVAKVDYKHVNYGRTVPYDELFQLLLVLPPQSMDLLPSPLNNLYLRFPELFPTNVSIDAGGKRYAYEAEVILPAIDSDDLLDAHVELIKSSGLERKKGKTTSVFYEKKQYIEL